MKRRNYKHYLRRTHRYLGVLIGVQFLFWTVGGLYFSWTNIKEIRGEHLRSDHEHSIDANVTLADIGPAMQRLRGDRGASAIDGFRTVDVLGRLNYLITFKNAADKTEYALTDAASGEQRPDIDSDEAIRIAKHALIDPPCVAGVELISADNVGGHHEYRGKPLPAFAVRFDTSDRLTVYISKQTGQVGAVRTDKWRVFDFLWMMHTLDLNERDNINNYLLRAFSTFGVLTILSGFVLFFVSSKLVRRLLFR